MRKKHLRPIHPSIQRFCADAGYRKTFEQDVSNVLGLGVDISVRIKPEWEVLPKRWIVERSPAWINNSRRLSKDYKISVCSAQAVCTIASFRTLLKRFYPIGTASKNQGELERFLIQEHHPAIVSRELFEIVNRIGLGNL